MTAEACIAHQLECLVHPGEFVRVEQLRPGASYLMLVTDVEYFDYMKKSDQTKQRDAVERVALLRALREVLLLADRGGLGLCSLEPAIRIA